jgi:phosphoribosylanthranilate isomerase
LTKVKICGITNISDLELVTGLGTDAIGVIVDVPQSPRNTTRQVARDIVRKTPVFTKTVLVMAPGSLEDAVSLCNYVEPDVVQIHGNELNIKDLSEATKGIKIIQTVNPEKKDEIDPVSLKYCDAILLDSLTSNQLGGTGKVHDWRKSRRMVDSIKPKQLILAGGLNPDNVKEAIELVRPYGVDVCTGTEGSPGEKDPVKVQRFLSMVSEIDGRGTNE